MRHLTRYLVAIGIALGAIAPALPDGAAGSVRSIVFAVSLASIGAGVYLGAPKPA